MWKTNTKYSSTKQAITVLNNTLFLYISLSKLGWLVRQRFGHTWWDSTEDRDSLLVCNNEWSYSVPRVIWKQNSKQTQSSVVVDSLFEITNEVNLIPQSVTEDSQFESICKSGAGSNDLRRLLICGVGARSKDHRDQLKSWEFFINNCQLQHEGWQADPGHSGDTSHEDQDKILTFYWITSLSPSPSPSSNDNLSSLPAMREVGGGF